MFRHAFIPILVLCIASGLMYGLIFKGEVKESLQDFWAWSKAKFKAIPWALIGHRVWVRVRGIRRVINIPFQGFLHDSTKTMPFALGQVWTGPGKTTFTVVGKTEDQRWVMNIASKSHISVLQSLLDPKELREIISELKLYLYDWDQSTDYTPCSVVIFGVKAAVLQRKF